MSSPRRRARVAIVDDERFDAHRPASQHPERPERLFAARSGLSAGLVRGQASLLAPSWVRDDDLLKVHPQGYVRSLLHAIRAGEGHLDPDTYIARESEAAAFLAAGGAAEMARALMRSETDAGVALVRPPGHHATRGRPMGFCLLNNIAISAHAALAAGAERVAIVDWDVHHGNGTQEAFYGDPRVLFISLHQWPFYPGTGTPEEVGAGAGFGSTLNIAMPAGAGPEAYGEAFRALVLPALERFGADLILVSAGFDAHERDPLGELHLDDATYAAMAGALLCHADALGHGRVGFVLEGGYDLYALEGSLQGVAKAISGQAPDLPEGKLREVEREAIARSLVAHSVYSERGRPQ